MYNLYIVAVRLTGHYNVEVSTPYFYELGPQYESYDCTAEAWLEVFARDEEEARRLADEWLYDPEEMAVDEVEITGIEYVGQEPWEAPEVVDIEYHGLPDPDSNIWED